MAFVVPGTSQLVAPSPAGPERSLPLTYLDALWTHASAVERVFFYPGATPDVIPALVDSLSRALAAFYPLAGRLRLTPGTPNRYEIYYQPGDAVTFTVAECHHVGGIDELATMSGHPTKVAEILPLVPPLPEGGAVLAVQATVLRGGLALGISYHHAACDGASSAHFIHSWAWAATGGLTGAAGGAPEPPVIDRTFIRIPHNDDHVLVRPPRPSGGPAKSRDRDADLLLATFTLSKEHLQSVKDTVAREAERRGVPAPRCTSTVAAFGLIWHCHALAKPSRREAAPEERAYFLFMADHRARLEVPAKYLGNCISPCMASAPAKHLSAAAAAAAGRLFTACAAVGASVEQVLRGGPEYWDGWIERVREAFGAGEMPLAVAGSPSFRVYEVDFGFGRPAKTHVVSAARSGGIAVAEARGGGGGMEIGVSLPPDAMARFQECFDAAMAVLLVDVVVPAG